MLELNSCALSSGKNESHSIASRKKCITILLLPNVCIVTNVPSLSLFGADEVLRISADADGHGGFLRVCCRYRGSTEGGMKAMKLHPWAEKAQILCPQTW